MRRAALIAVLLMVVSLAAAEIMRRMGLKSCILVSDGYHIYRAKNLLWVAGMGV